MGRRTRLDPELGSEDLDPPLSLPRSGNSRRISGTINRINREKGFGFIRAADGLDYFFHYSELKTCSLEELAEGDRVTFLAVKAEKGWRANEIHEAQAETNDSA